MTTPFFNSLPISTPVVEAYRLDRYDNSLKAAAIVPAVL